MSRLSKHCLKLQQTCIVIQSCGMTDQKPPDEGEKTVGDLQHDYIPSRVRKRLVKKGIQFDEDAQVSSSKIPITPGQTISEHLADTTEERLMGGGPEFPSDYVKTIHKTQTYHAPKLPAEKLAVLLFPGQGSQFVGMGKNLLKYPGVTELYEKASSVLGYDLLQVCLNGPTEKLTQTLYCQPAIFVASIAALEKMKEEHLMVICLFYCTMLSTISHYLKTYQSCYPKLS